MSDANESAQAAETLISASVVLPIRPDNISFDDYAVAISADQIVAIGPAATLLQRYPAAQHVHLEHHILMPGLVNAHGHLAMTLLRGLGEGQQLDDWLRTTIWPLEARYVDAGFVADGTRLAIAEMIATGTTCASDMYYFPDVVANVAAEVGMRMQIAFPIIGVPNAWSQDVGECFSKGLELHDKYRNDPFIYMAFGPHAPYTVDAKSLEKTLAYADELDLQIQMHVHETAAEVSVAHTQVGCGWVEHLHNIGLLNPRLQAVHMTQLTDADIERVAHSGAKVVHCPQSNMKLASGACPLSSLIAQGVDVALGTDGAASNNGLDLFQELRTASLLAKLIEGDPTAAPANKLLEVATLGGARTLGLENVIGTLEPGKAADMIAIDTRGTGMQPLHDPFAQLVHSRPGTHVSDVWIGGRSLLREGRFTHIDVNQINERAAMWRSQISGSV